MEMKNTFENIFSNTCKIICANQFIDLLLCTVFKVHSTQQVIQLNDNKPLRLASFGSILERRFLFYTFLFFTSQ